MDETYYKLIRKEIDPLVPRKPGLSVLEIGCAEGATMRWLRLNHSINYAAGVEINPTVAYNARSVFDEIEEADAACAQLDFRCAAFDLILALDVLEHMLDPWTFVQNIRNKLAPDGVFIASIPNIAHYQVSFPLLLRGSWEYSTAGVLDRTHLRFFNKRSAIALFEGNGFRISRVLTNTLYPNIFGVNNGRLRWYSQKFMHILAPRSRLFDLQFIIAAEHAPKASAPVHSSDKC